MPVMCLHACVKQTPKMHQTQFWKMALLTFSQKLPKATKDQHVSGLENKPKTSFEF